MPEIEGMTFAPYAHQEWPKWARKMVGGALVEQIVSSEVEEREFLGLPDAVDEAPVAEPEAAPMPEAPEVVFAPAEAPTSDDHPAA